MQTQMASLLLIASVDSSKNATRPARDFLTCSGILNVLLPRVSHFTKVYLHLHCCLSQIFGNHLGQFPFAHPPRLFSYFRLLIGSLQCVLKPSTFLHLHCSNRPSASLWSHLSLASLQSIHYVAARVNFKNTELIAPLFCLKSSRIFHWFLWSSSKDLWKAL